MGRLRGVIEQRFALNDVSQAEMGQAAALRETLLHNGRVNASGDQPGDSGYCGD
jgi:hypothetical protein